MEILEKLNIESAEIQGVECICVGDFAKVIKKSPAHISNLIAKGNSVRKLKCIRSLGAPRIPVSEITEFPFTTVGRNCHVYYYQEDGTIRKGQK
jgi:hypothetical protein